MLYSSVSIINFEHVIVGWVYSVLEFHNELYELLQVERGISRGLVKGRVLIQTFI